MSALPTPPAFVVTTKTGTTIRPWRDSLVDALQDARECPPGSLVVRSDGTLMARRWRVPPWIVAIFERYAGGADEPGAEQ